MAWFIFLLIIIVFVVNVNCETFAGYVIRQRIKPIRLSQQQQQVCLIDTGTTRHRNFQDLGSGRTDWAADRPAGQSRDDLDCMPSSSSSPAGRPSRKSTVDSRTDSESLAIIAEWCWPIAVTQICTQIEPMACQWLAIGSEPGLKSMS